MFQIESLVRTRILAHLEHVIPQAHKCRHGEDLARRHTSVCETKVLLRELLPCSAAAEAAEAYLPMCLLVRRRFLADTSMTEISASPVRPIS